MLGIKLILFFNVTLGMQKPAAEEYKVRLHEPIIIREEDYPEPATEGSFPIYHFVDLKFHNETNHDIGVETITKDARAFKFRYIAPLGKVLDEKPYNIDLIDKFAIYYGRTKQTPIPTNAFIIPIEELKQRLSQKNSSKAIIKIRTGRFGLGLAADYDVLGHLKKLEEIDLLASWAELKGAVLPLEKEKELLFAKLGEIQGKELKPESPAHAILNIPKPPTVETRHIPLAYQQALNKAYEDLTQAIENINIEKELRSAGVENPYNKLFNIVASARYAIAKKIGFDY